MRLYKKKILVGFTGFLLVMVIHTAHGVVTQFDDIALDGQGTNPFIRFDGSGIPDKFIVSFNDHFGFWSGASYSLRIYQSAPSNSLVLQDGNVIIGGNLEISSSQHLKSDIHALSSEQAMDAFTQLKPVTFKYLNSPDTQSIGFIAEDVPELVATENRKSLRPMDMVALLTKVVQEQQQTIDALGDQVASLCAKQAC